MADIVGDNSKLEVQNRPCKTCPFEGEIRIALRQESMTRYTSRIVNLEGVHLCHSVDNEKICRGGQNIMLKVLFAKGVINAPTDEAFVEARKAHLGF